MRINTLVLVKALAITLVVANHSGIAQGLIQGGLNALLIVSGISMATFAFKESTCQTLRAFRLFTLRIAIPSFLLALFWQIAVSNVSLLELTFISNWFYKWRVVGFPIWYVQIIVQLMIAFSILFWALDLTPKIKKAPVRTTFIALLLSVLACVVSYAFWDTWYLRDKLPHLLAWNFTFGWFFWALAIKNRKTLKFQFILSCTLIICGILTLILTDAKGGEARFVWLTFFGFILIWFDTIVLPAVLARMLLLISQATFVIFLLHHASIGRLVWFGELFGFVDFVKDPTVRFIVGLIMPVFIWAFFTAIMRSYKRMKYEKALHIF